MATVGDRITSRRRGLGWTQDQLAQKAGISKSFLSEFGNSKRSVSADNLLDIARVLALSLDYLMTGQASQDSPPDVPIPSTLATFADEEGLSFRHTLMLLEFQKQIVEHRSTKKKHGLEGVDWRRFYEGVKEFLRTNESARPGARDHSTRSETGHQSQGVENTLPHCRRRVDGWMADAGAISDIDSFEAVVTSRLHTELEEVHCDDDWFRVKDTYALVSGNLFSLRYNPSSIIVLARLRSVGPKASRWT